MINTPHDSIILFYVLMHQNDKIFSFCLTLLGNLGNNRFQYEKA